MLMSKIINKTRGCHGLLCNQCRSLDFPTPSPGKMKGMPTLAIVGTNAGVEFLFMRLVAMVPCFKGDVEVVFWYTYMLSSLIFK